MCGVPRSIRRCARAGRAAWLERAEARANLDLHHLLTLKVGHRRAFGSRGPAAKGAAKGSSQRNASQNPPSRGSETLAEELVGPLWRMVSNAGQQQWCGGYPCTLDGGPMGHSARSTVPHERCDQVIREDPAGAVVVRACYILAAGVERGRWATRVSWKINRLFFFHTPASRKAAKPWSYR